MQEPLLEINETGLSEAKLVDFSLPEGSGAALDTYLMTVEDAAGNPGKYLLVIKTG